MICRIKKIFYFPVAFYFRFFAKIRLSYWKPKIIIVTGSSGKTTLLNLIESQIGTKAKYSHHANSSYGIPFNILGLERKTLSLLEWPVLFLLAPLKTFSLKPKEDLYIVEADCDRPEEGKFLATFLKPEVTLWTNSTRTHSMNFDNLVQNNVFKNVEQAIGYEYGYFIEYTSKLIIVNGDSEIIKEQLPRSNVKIVSITIKNLMDYKVALMGTEFKIDKKVFKFNQLLPRETFYSLKMCLDLLKYLKCPVNQSFDKFILPPGRSNRFKGIKNTTIIDSSYNANLDSMKVILDMFDNITAENKWAVLGDMLEQGKSEKEEHEKLADEIAKIKLEKIILMGPRISKYLYPKLITINEKQITKNEKIVKFLNPDEVLNYLKANLNGGELLLFKGARFLEGVIENLLLNKSEAKKLCRREKIWQERRKKFGL